MLKGAKPHQVLALALFLLIPLTFVHDQLTEIKTYEEAQDVAIEMVANFGTAKSRMKKDIHEDSSSEETNHISTMKPARSERLCHQIPLYYLCSLK